MLPRNYIYYIKIIFSIIIILILVWLNDTRSYWTRGVNIKPIFILLLGVLKSIGTRKTIVKKSEWIVLSLLLCITISFYFAGTIPSICTNVIIKSGLYSVLYFVTGEQIGYVIKGNTIKEK